MELGTLCTEADRKSRQLGPIVKVLLCTRDEARCCGKIHKQGKVLPWLPEADPEVSECEIAVYLGGMRNSKSDTEKRSHSIKGGLYWLPVRATRVHGHGQKSG